MISKIINNLKDNIEKIVLVFTLVLCLAIGYFIGLNTGINQNLNKINTEKTHFQSSISTSENDQSPYTLTKSETNIIFLKPNDEMKNCPKSHPIKGVFRDGVGFYYLPENKFYNRIKENLCFKTKDDAINIGGFIQK
jgi:hypothetical protein